MAGDKALNTLDVVCAVKTCLNLRAAILDLILSLCLLKAQETITQLPNLAFLDGSSSLFLKLPI